MTIEIDIVSRIPQIDSIICFCEPHSTRYGKKVYVTCPFRAKDALKDLSWSETHRRWDPEQEMWEIDTSGLAYAINTLAKDDYNVAVTEDVAVEVLDEPQSEIKV
ncbi:hypothetical protein ACOZ4I_20305 (plasmid) [Haloarcula salina]|uniref:hypothetical protein n=1 Tax=Haloarcula salina TaxID=1429914 RepID=UPI003C6EF5E8